MIRYPSLEATKLTRLDVELKVEADGYWAGRPDREVDRPGV